MTAIESPCIQAKTRRAFMAVPTLNRAQQSCRAVVHYGPWRHAARALVRLARPPRDELAEHENSFIQLNTSQLVRAIRADGSAVAGVFPSEALIRLRTITDRLPPGEYCEFEHVPDVRSLVRCSATLDAVRGYLRAEPELLECSVIVAEAEDSTAPLAYDSQRHWHFDYAGWHSLNLFVYLTDVAEDSGAHEVVAGTHGRRRMWDAVRAAIPDHEIRSRYPGRIRTILGPAGTMFFEDTSAFHRRRMHTRRRVMLNIVYASHRSWLSTGRLTLRYSDYLRAHPDFAVSVQ